MTGTRQSGQIIMGKIILASTYNSNLMRKETLILIMLNVRVLSHIEANRNIENSRLLVKQHNNCTL